MERGVSGETEGVEREREWRVGVNGEREREWTESVYVERGRV